MDVNILEPLVRKYDEKIRVHVDACQQVKREWNKELKWKERDQDIINNLGGQVSVLRNQQK